MGTNASSRPNDCSEPKTMPFCGKTRYILPLVPQEQTTARKKRLYAYIHFSSCKTSSDGNDEDREEKSQKDSARHR